MVRAVSATTLLLAAFGVGGAILILAPEPRAGEPRWLSAVRDVGTVLSAIGLVGMLALGLIAGGADVDPQDVWRGR